MQGDPSPILLVEDNEDHAEITLFTLEENEVENPVHWVKDGQEAIDYLFNQGDYADTNKY